MEPGRAARAATAATTMAAATAAAPNDKARAVTFAVANRFQDARVLEPAGEERAAAAALEPGRERPGRHHP